MNNFKFKVLEDEQFLSLIKDNKILCTARNIKVYVRNTLDHYDKEPLLHTDRFRIKHSNLLIEYYKEQEEKLYNAIKSYKGFFGLDITKNVMVTIEYWEVVIGKQTITYIV